ncbi:DUF829-domain-containing protein [Thozetella sp. PMI_491]|nr:DUF829-domain-containing protein [Thozetella sp. PMI_491]
MALQQQAADPLAAFSKVSDQVFVRPADAAATAGPDHPDVVLLFGWGDAMPKHVAKYAAGYLALFPAAKIVLVVSPMLKTFVRTIETIGTAMLPALDATFAGEEKAAGKEPRILIHAMSNTGGTSLAATLLAYRDRFRGGAKKALPVEMLVLDSTPGGWDLMSNVTRWSHAMAVGIKHMFPWPFWLTRGLSVMFLMTVFGMAYLLGKPSTAKFSTLAMNRDKLSMKAPRLYLYSKEDDVIPWDQVEKHAAYARNKGYDVSLQLFQGSNHVGHLRLQPDLYWSSISRAWAERKQRAS